MNKNIISLENIAVSFDGERVLNNIKLDIRDKEFVTLLGPSGCGKTTTLRTIGGFITPDSGEIIVSGKRLGRDIDIPKNIGLIIETPGFLPNFSGLNNLLQLAKIRNKLTKDDVRAVMNKVGLNPDEKKHVGKYSLGMRQRLGIAQAIMENPDILILDEPMNGLDKDGVEDMRKLFLALKNDGKTIIMASHNPTDIDVLCDRVFEITKGVLKQVR